MPRSLQDGSSARKSKIAQRVDGRSLLNSRLAVHHKKGQRDIFDRRPSNEGEHRLPWTRLPAGFMLCRLRVPAGFGLRGSGDDLESYFYQRTKAECMVPRRALARWITGTAAAQMGMDPARTYRLAPRIIGMGTSSGPDIAQSVHEDTIRRAGCLDLATILHYRAPLPGGPT